MVSLQAISPGAPVSTTAMPIVALDQSVLQAVYSTCGKTKCIRLFNPYANRWLLWDNKHSLVVAGYHSQYPQPPARLSFRTSNSYIFYKYPTFLPAPPVIPHLIPVAGDTIRHLGSVYLATSPLLGPPAAERVVLGMIIYWNRRSPGKYQRAIPQFCSRFPCPP